MISQGLTLKGPFVVQILQELPTHEVDDEGRLIYVDPQDKLYLGKETSFAEIGALGLSGYSGISGYSGYAATAPAGSGYVMLNDGVNGFKGNSFLQYDEFQTGGQGYENGLLTIQGSINALHGLAHVYSLLAKNGVMFGTSGYSGYCALTYLNEDHSVYVMPVDNGQCSGYVMQLLPNGVMQWTNPDLIGNDYIYPLIFNTSYVRDASNVNKFHIRAANSNATPDATHPIQMTIPDGNTEVLRERSAAYLSGEWSFTLSDGTAYWGRESSDGTVFDAYIYAIWDGTGIVFALCGTSALTQVRTTATATSELFFKLEDSSTYSKNAAHYCKCIAKFSYEYDTGDTPDNTIDIDGFRHLTDYDRFIETNGIIHPFGLIKAIQVYNTDTQNLNTTSYVAVNWKGEDYKDDIYAHSNSTNPSRVTFLKKGIYKLTAHIVLDNTSLSAKNVKCAFRVNGGTPILRGVSYTYSPNENNEGSTNQTSTLLWELNRNDYVEVVGIRWGNKTGQDITEEDECYFLAELVKYT